LPDAANASKQGSSKGAQPQKRKRKTQQQQGKPNNLSSFCSLTVNLKPMSTQQRIFVLDHRCFLLRNLDKVRDWRDRQKDRMKQQAQQQQQQTSNIGRNRRFFSTSRPSNDPSSSDKGMVAVSAASVRSSTLPEGATSSRIEKLEEIPTPIASDPSFAVEEGGANGEEVVRCRCRLFDDEGLMVQCERCESWEHSDCLGPAKAAVALAAEHYVCSTCAGQPINREDLNIVLVPQPENSPEGQTFYLSLVYKDLQVRQGDCVYVLRDHDTPDRKRTLWANVPDPGHQLPTPRPPHHLPAHLKLRDLDIFQIERIWIDENGKEYVWGHHFFRPKDTFHEPTRKFYINELLYSPLQEAIPIWAVAGRCWVLDPATFSKGRPIDAVEEHVYICEHRVDRTARLFSKNSRSKFSICTRRFAFRNFVTRLKPQRTFQPHGAPPPLSSSKKGGTEIVASSSSATLVDKAGSKKKKVKKEQQSSLPATPKPQGNLVKVTDLICVNILF